MSAKRRTSKSTKKRKASRRRKPKVTLNSKSVMALAVVVIVLCVVFLAVSIYTGAPFYRENAPAQTPAVTSQPAEVKEQPSAESNRGTETKQSAASSRKDSGSSVSTSQSSPKASGTEKSDNKQSASSETAAKKSSASASENKSTISSETGKGKEVASVKDTTVPVKPAPEEQPAKYNIPEAQNNATLCFVIDDAGQNINNLKRYTSLPFPLTVALLPQLTNSKACSWVVRSSGKELILHQPMQSLNLKLDPGPGKITPDMSTLEIAELVKKNIEEVGPVKGMNNHEGSLITENEIKIGAVLEVCQEKGIYFLDSRTTAQTKAPQAALERDMTIYERDVFLDDVVTREAMLQQIYRGLGIANKKGKAIIIGHVDKSVNILPDLLKDMYPYLVEKGYKFATPSTLNQY